VRVIDNFSTGKRENLTPFRDSVEVIEGDIRSYHIVSEAVRGIDAILHQAALPSVPRSIRDPITTNDVVVVGTLNVLQAALGAGVKRVVYASSSSVYGDTPELPKREDTTPNPLSPYAVAKLAGEKYCSVFARIYNLEVVALRYFNVFGPRQDPTSQYAAVIPKFALAMMQGIRPVIYGDGEQSRDFTYVADIVSANLAAAEAANVSGLVMNVACNRSVSLNQMVAHLNKILSTDITPIYEAPRPGEVRHSLADVDRASALLGYRPATSFEEGLRLTVASLNAKLNRH